MYVITGVTGNIGSKLAMELVSKGKKVKGIARNVSKAPTLKEKGAELISGDLIDTKFLTETFKGATAVFAMIPPNFKAEDFRKYMNGLGDSLVTAIKNSGVKKVVALSSVGANLPEGNGIVQGLYDYEQKLQQLKDVDVLILRPTYFMENLYNNLDMIRSMGSNGGAIKANIPFPMVSTKDIAHKVAERLTNLDFKGITVEYVLGPKDYTLKEVTAILGKAIGKPDLNYMEFSYPDVEKAMTAAGLSPSSAKALVGLQKFINEGLFTSQAKRNPSNTTPTTLEEFSAAFAQAYKSLPVFQQ